MNFNSVLIIDDDDEHRFIVKEMFKKIGCQNLMESSSGPNALQILKELKSDGDGTFLPDLILLDINMPEMDGFGFIEKLLALNDGNKPNSFVAMVTASCFPNDIKRIQENDNIDGWLHKPYDMKTITKMIDEAL